MKFKNTSCSTMPLDRMILIMINEHMVIQQLLEGKHLYHILMDHTNTMR